MTYDSEPRGTTIRRTRMRWTRVIGPLVVVAAITAAPGQWPSLPSSTASRSLMAAVPVDLSHSEHGADGGASGRTTVFDDGAEEVANLDPGLLDALRRAATDAADDGIELVVNSGWRSPEHQQRLLREAVVTYGSATEAARWVATPNTSAHVSGDAVDIGPREAAAWLAQHGAGYGLCPIYGNEPWHYERRPKAADHGCPPAYADPTYDPRMQR